jgi:hypothetical protein
MQVLHLDLNARSGFDPHGIVACFARQPGMLPEKPEIRGTGMVEFLLVESGHMEFPAIVFQMAAGAVRRPPRCERSARMVPPLRFHSLLDFHMTIQTFEAALTQAEVMAGGALGRPFQILVSSRQGAGRNLGDRGNTKKHGGDGYPEEPHAF